MEIDIKKHIDEVETSVRKKDLSPRETDKEVRRYVREEINYGDWEYDEIIEVLAQLKMQHGFDDAFVTSEVPECNTWREIFDSMMGKALFSVLHDHVMDSHDGMIREDTNEILQYEPMDHEEVEELIKDYTSEAEQRAREGEVPDVDRDFEHHTLRLNHPESGEEAEAAAYHTVKDHYQDFHGEKKFIRMASVLDGLEELYGMDGTESISKEDLTYESKVGWRDIVEQGLVFPAVKYAVRHNMDAE